MKIRLAMQYRAHALAVAGLLLCFVFVTPLRGQKGTAPGATILTPSDVVNIMPATVFFRGQSATVQIRNTYGLRFPGGKLLLAGLVDTSGYSTGIKTKYQGYLLTESELTIGGKTLLPGAYGFGFIANNQFVVMDLGAHDVFQVASTVDSAMKRPRPLLIRPGMHPGAFRLYAGRSYVTIRRK